MLPEKVIMETNNATAFLSLKHVVLKRINHDTDSHLIKLLTRAHAKSTPAVFLEKQNDSPNKPPFLWFIDGVAAALGPFDLS
jgi:hypothetical protein